jgi:DNA-binding Xre family transcriptional regulator
MNKTDLRNATGITTTALAKLGRNENVNTEVLVKICKALECNIEDILEIVDEVPTDKNN